MKILNNTKSYLNIIIIKDRTKNIIFKYENSKEERYKIHIKILKFPENYIHNYKNFPTKHTQKFPRRYTKFPTFVKIPRIERRTVYTVTKK